MQINKCILVREIHPKLCTHSLSKSTMYEFQDTADTNPQVTAIRSQDRTSGEWATWSYHQVNEDVKVTSNDNI